MDRSKSNKMDDKYYGMISEDRSAQANLPQNVKMENYPRNIYLSSDLDDSIKGIDEVEKDNDREVSKYRSDSKY